MAKSHSEQAIRPMLAYSKPIDVATMDMSSGPVHVSPKLDGIRCLAMDGMPMSRTLKVIPNVHIQVVLRHPKLHGLDGELVVGEATAPDCINATTSGVMSRGGTPDFRYYVFDCWHTPRIGFRQRYGYLKRRMLELHREGLPVTLVPQVLCHTVAEVEEATGLNYELGYEGSIIRSFDGEYKYNRSTLAEGLLLKVKSFLDSEIHVTGFVEMKHNANEATTDERGFTKRSSHKDNKVPSGTLGKILGIDTASGVSITIGAGKMTAPEKLHVWQNQEKYLGQLAKYRYAPYGVKDLPRHPRFITWRDPIDMST